LVAGIAFAAPAGTGVERELEVQIRDVDKSDVADYEKVHPETVKTKGQVEPRLVEPEPQKTTWPGLAEWEPRKLGIPKQKEPALDYLQAAVAAADRAHVLFLIQLILLGLIVLPFLPGMREIFNPRDDKPLAINMEYTKDPRYFETSFKKMIRRTIPEPMPGIHHVRLSKKEVAEVISSSKIFPENISVPHVVYLHGRLASGSSVRFEKEVYATGDITLGKDNLMRAMASDGDITLGDGSRVMRWVGTSGSITAGENCDLGIKAACDGNIVVGRGSTFRSLFASNVTIPRNIVSGEPFGPPLPEPTKRDKKKSWSLFKPFRVEANDTVNEDIETRRSVIVGENATVRGNISTRRTLTIGRGAKIHGDIFAEKRIEIEEGARVYGSIVCLDEILIGPNVEVQHVDKNIHIIARENLEVGPGCLIKGSIKSNGRAVFEESTIVDGNIFAEGSIYLGRNMTVQENVFSQETVAVSPGVVVGHPGTVKSLISKKGISLYEGVTIYGLLLTDGEGVVQ